MKGAAVVLVMVLSFGGWAPPAAAKMSPEVARFVKQLRSRDADVRMAAAQTLGEMGAKAAVAALADQMRRDKVVGVRYRAAQALGIIGDAAACERLTKALLRDREGLVRHHAALALGAIGDRSVMWALLRALKLESDPLAKRGVLDAVTRMPDPKALTLLLMAMRDGDVGVRAAAARALTALGDKKALPILREVLKGDVIEVQVRAAHGVYKLSQDPAALELLAGALTHERYDVGEAASESLGAIGKPAVPLLFAVVDEAMDETAVTHAEDALKQITGRSFGGSFRWKAFLLKEGYLAPETPPAPTPDGAALPETPGAPTPDAPKPDKP